MRHFVFLMSFLLAVLPGYAQLPLNDPKVQRASDILRRVGSTFDYNGKYRLPRLVLFRKQSSQRIAYLDSDTDLGKEAVQAGRKRLVLDERLFDVCERIDGNSGAALAFVIAHELAHLQYKHMTQLSFAEVNKRTTGHRLGKWQRASQQEVQADQEGLLHAYLAGYDPQPVLGRLFDTLYMAYNLPDELPGYPPKTVRKKQTQLQAETLRPAALLFGIAQTLYCRGYVEEAAQCYERILNWDIEQHQHYPLREVFNNLGLCRLRQALAASPEHPLRYFILPFELDPQNRLLLLDRRGQPKPNPLVVDWLRQADEQFSKAIALDRAYVTAYYNRATGSLLRQNYLMALGHLEEVQEFTPTRSLSGTWWTICSLAYYGQKQFVQAQTAMQQAKTREHQSASNRRSKQAISTTAYNLQTLDRLLKQPGTLPVLPQLATMGCQPTESGLVDAERPQNLTFSRVLLHETKPDSFLKIYWATLRNRTYVEVTLTRGMFVLTAPY